MTYQQLALVYDRFMKNAPYDQWVRFIQQAIYHHEKPVKTIVDLGCGTGEITVRLNALGFDMIGIDNSSTMLALANEKATANKEDILWIQQDLKEYTGLVELDCAISCCDVINYIPSIHDLENVFQRIANSLRQGGLFLFDVHSISHVENNLASQTFTNVQDENAYIWVCHPGDHTGEMEHEITFFSKNEDDTYERFDEYHYQRTYPIKDYIHLLEKAGFSRIKTHADFSLKKDNISDKSERIFFIAEKK